MPKHMHTPLYPESVRVRPDKRLYGRRVGTIQPTWLDSRCLASEVVSLSTATTSTLPLRVLQGWRPDVQSANVYLVDIS